MFYTIDGFVHVLHQEWIVKIIQTGTEKGFGIIEISDTTLHEEVPQGLG